MTKLTFKSKYNSETEKFQGTLGIWLEDLKLKLSLTDKTLRNVGSIKEDTEIAVEKPGHFILEHHFHKKHTRFQFHGHTKVADKPVKLTFVHHHGPGVTTLEANAKLGDHSRAIVKHNFAKDGPMVRLEQDYKDTTLKPLYDFGEGKWALGFQIKQKLKKDHLEVSYWHHRERAEVEYHKHIDDDGPFKVTAVFHCKHGGRRPALLLEKEWKFSV
ncbi:hypothetical protein CLOM_g6847 [Closterium sp. NIES-68]|nr:hypothetical protein CLOM_g6847 [Closterium sp. NIES-68]GJP72382.1 hypothetical protein CLOP_g3121 [Closterium sp. NIES-67]